MRYHFWQFLLNQEGQPINDANISIFRAGTTTPVTVYTGELSSDSVSVAPQLTTSSNGYFEFWIGDEEEPLGYERGTKFKIQWERAGISSGIVDNIEVFQTMEGVDETDPDSIYKNKLISNALAYRFTNHSEHDVLNDGFPIHGIMPIDVDATDNVSNKVVSNRLANGWETHSNFNFDMVFPEDVENSPHDLQPIQYDSSDSTYNKLMSNQVLFNIQSQITNIVSSIHYESIASSAWALSGGKYEYNVIHNLDIEYPTITCWNTTTKSLLAVDTIESIDHDTIKVIILSPVDSYIKVSKL